MFYDTIILGGGIAGLSLAYFLDRKSCILEAQEKIGGLCRSFNKNGVTYDVGPHIIFSKNKEVLRLMQEVADTHELKRSNQIFHRGHFVKYPFENFLAQLGNEDEINYCRDSFLNNPYRNMKSDNMLAFFLKTFGEGITRLYLQPYNEKIWKFDPAMMDTQMVDRIPQPPDQDIIDSCGGNYKEGYLHQLHFHYPKKGGVQSLCDGFAARIAHKSEMHCNAKAKKIRKTDRGWSVETTAGETFEGKEIFNCIPLHELFLCLDTPPTPVSEALADLKYNSIHIVIINAKKDRIQDHFSMMFPQEDVIFHRVNRLNFLGDNYCLPDGSATFLVEVTFRKGTKYAHLTPQEVVDRCIEDLHRLEFIDKNDVQFTDIHTEKYAYVIYDLNNQPNKQIVLSYLQSLGIESVGRFAEFEYLNSDHVIERTQRLAEKRNKVPRQP